MIQNKQDLTEYLEADKRSLGRNRKRPAINDVIWKYEILLRKCEYYQNCRHSFTGKLIGKLYKYLRFRLELKCNFSIPLNTCGKGLFIAHVGPVIINDSAVLGENCRIHVCVNIGADAKNGSLAPRIGDNVYIGPGAKLFGDIVIADDIAIGANAVVNKSFLQPGVSIAGVPAKVISDKGTQDILNR